MKKTLHVLLLLVVLSAPAALAQDPTAPGPFAVTREEYNFGDTAFTPTNFPGPVELLASVHHPTDLTGGPFPLVVFLHGRHATCFNGQGAAFLEWPCSDGRTPIPSYQGYDYVGALLASQGYFVVSISANGVNAVDNTVFDLGALARAELIQKHLDILKGFTTSGGAPFGTRFVGKIDLTRIGTMGHSRGGEGVARHVTFNVSQGSPYGIRAVLPLAPTDFNRTLVNNVPLLVMLPYCDGDVTNLQGVHFYDDVRYNVPGDPASKHYVLVMGADHDFFNTVWSPSSGIPGAADDWIAFVPGGESDSFCGKGKTNQRLTESQQRAVSTGFFTAFFRTFVGGETQFLPILTGDAPPPPGVTHDLHVTFHAPDNPFLRRDLNRFLTSTELSTNVLGGAVTPNALSPYEICGGPSPFPPKCIPSANNSQQPHTSPSARSNAPGLSQLHSGWTSTSGSLQDDLTPGQRNVSGFQAIQFRVVVDFSDPRNVTGVPQDFHVALTDTSGFTASVAVSSVSSALYFPPGETIVVPKIVLSTVRIPLSAFRRVNLNAVKSVVFQFDQRPQGNVLIDDVAFASAQ
ncbi:MAG TPA: hypothetical protein VGA84_14455 [Thermoanaerobaculia bacterium]